MRLPSLPSFAWQAFPRDPLITPPFPDPLLADPSVLTDRESPDKRWHLFAHGAFGLYHYTSDDGIQWHLRKLLSLFSVRPFIYREHGTFFLFSEKLSRLWGFPHYNSHIELRYSKDLRQWSKPQAILRPSLPWHRTSNTRGNVGNPCVVRVGKKYRLYFSAGLTYLPDCHCCEPKNVAFAVSDQITGPFVSRKMPLFSYNPDSPSRLHRTTTLRVYKQDNGFIGLQTHLDLNTAKGTSSTALHILRSRDGIRWQKKSVPVVQPDHARNSHVYVGDLKRKGRQVRIYYNARHKRQFWTEAIGLVTATI